MFKCYHPFVLEILSNIYDEFGRDEFACRDTERHMMVPPNGTSKTEARKFLFRMLSRGGYQRAGNYKIRRKNNKSIFCPRTYKLTNNAIESITDWKERQISPSKCRKRNK